MKIGLVGSRKYENKKRIKDFIFKLKKEKGTQTTIVSGGCKDGADKYVKKYTLELGLQYVEYPPFHSTHSLYCPLPESRFNQPFAMKNFFVRNKIIAQASDIVVGFIPKGVDSNGTNNTLQYAKKFGKKILIID